MWKPNLPLHIKVTIKTLFIHSLLLFLALFENIARTSSIDDFDNKFNKVFLTLHTAMSYILQLVECYNSTRV